MTLNDFLISNKEKILKVVLTDEEREEAYFEGQKKKYFREKHKAYWDEQERQNISVNTSHGNSYGGS